MARLMILFFSLCVTVAAFGLNIRPATSSDTDALYGLICELALYEGKDIASLSLTKDNLREFGFGSHPYFFAELVEEDNQLVGYALYFYAFSGNKGYPVLYIDDLYVKETYRGCGIGTLLLKQLARYALERNCCRLEWHVFDWNQPAIAFYEKLGSTLKKELVLVRLEQEGLRALAE
jgi:GNAT superfamily N-acetyltransferase